jgi:Tfp pilus assembly protein PilF
MDDLPTVIRLEAAIARAGGSAAQWYELGGAKLRLGDAAGAAAAYERCLTLEPPRAPVYNNLGAALLQSGRINAAIEALEAALALESRHLRALVNLGKALREAGRLPEAEARLREALALEPGYPPALVNLGDVLAGAGDLAAAQDALEQAVRLAPALVEAHMSLGLVRLQRGASGAALDALRSAVALGPEHADAHSNLAHALFVLGQWEAAWPHFEYRFGRSRHRVSLSTPAGMARWEGTPSRDLELWLLGEQGLGDQIQFVRYAPLLGALGRRCVVACDPRLVALFEQAALGASVMPHDAAGAAGAAGAASEARAQWLPLMSVPAWHRTRPETVPAAAGYLVAESARVARWRARLPAAGLRVALAWAGNPRMESGRHRGRSPPLAALEPLLRVPAVRFISLQKGAGEEQLDAAPFGRAILRFADLDAGPDAFLDTAAVLKCVDLLVTSDTAIAHLAGALGVPTWVCLMHEPDWRWMRGGGETPWYTSMRLFRQRAPGDWSGVYSEAAAALALRASHASPHPPPQ